MIPFNTTPAQLQQRYNNELVAQGYTPEHALKEATRKFPTVKVRVANPSKPAPSPATVTNAVTVENSAGRLTTSRAASQEALAQNGITS